MKRSTEDFLNKIDDNSYMEWLIRLTKKGNIVKDINMAQSIILTSIDLNNLKYLKLFYQQIINYIEQKYDIPVFSSYGSYVVIKYNDYYFLFGFNEELHFCKQLASFNSKKYIKYEEIKDFMFQEKNKALIKSLDINQKTKRKPF